MNSSYQSIVFKPQFYKRSGEYKDKKYKASQFIKNIIIENSKKTFIPNLNYIFSKRYNGHLTIHSHIPKLKIINSLKNDLLINEKLKFIIVNKINSTLTNIKLSILGSILQNLREHNHKLVYINDYLLDLYHKSKIFIVSHLSILGKEVLYIKINNVKYKNYLDEYFSKRKIIFEKLIVCIILFLVQEFFKSKRKERDFDQALNDVITSVSIYPFVNLPIFNDKLLDDSNNINQDQDQDQDQDPTFSHDDQINFIDDKVDEESLSECCSIPDKTINFIIRQLQIIENNVEPIERNGIIYRLPFSDERIPLIVEPGSIDIDPPPLSDIPSRQNTQPVTIIDPPIEQLILAPRECDIVKVEDNIINNQKKGKYERKSILIDDKVELQTNLFVCEKIFYDNGEIVIGGDNEIICL